MSPPPWSLLARALACQVAGALAALAVHQAGWLHGWPLLGIASLGAGFCAWRMRLPRWWWVIGAAFPPAAAGVAALQLPAEWFAAALVASLLLFGTVMASRVPLWLSGRRARDALTGLLDELFPERSDLHAIDLGGGLGGLLLTLWRSGRCRHCAGIEWAPLPYLVGGLRLRLAGFPGRWRFGSLWRVDLGEYDLVYAFLSPAAMPRLWDKATREMREGSWLISYRFAVPGVPPDRRRAVGDDPEDALLLWRMPRQRR